MKILKVKYTADKLSGHNSLSNILPVMEKVCNLNLSRGWKLWNKDLKLKYLLSDIVLTIQTKSTEEEASLEESQSAVQLRNDQVKVFLLYLVYDLPIGYMVFS